MSNHSETLKTRRYLDLTIDDIPFRIRSLTAREKILLQRTVISGRTEKTETSLDDDLLWSAAVIGYCCVNADGNRIYGPESDADKKGWEAFRDDFAEWASEITGPLMDAIRVHTKLNRTYADTAEKKSEQTPNSNSQ